MNQQKKDNLEETTNNFICLVQDIITHFSEKNTKLSKNDFHKLILKNFEKNNEFVKYAKKYSYLDNEK